MKNRHHNFVVAMILCAWPVALVAQNPIPNAGFESWGGTALVGWSHNSSAPPLDVVARSADAHSGVSAVRGEVKSIAGFPFPPSLFAGTPQVPLFPISENHNSFSAYYKFQPQGGDMLFIEVVFQNQMTGGGAEGHAMIEAAAGSYTRVEIPMVYDPGNPPGFQARQANITITIRPPTGQTPHTGTFFLIDHLTFDNYPVSVAERTELPMPQQFALLQNYPNPFNPSTTINFDIPEQSFVQLKVFTVLGEEIATLVSEDLHAGSFSVNWNAAGMPTGVYMYSLNTGRVVLTKRMLLVK